MPGIQITPEINLRVFLIDVHCQTIMSGVAFRVAVKAYYFHPEIILSSVSMWFILQLIKKGPSFPPQPCGKWTNQQISMSVF